MTTIIGHRHRTAFAVAALAVFSILGGQPLKAGTAYVGTCVVTQSPFSLIQDAIDAVAIGWTIDVCPGIYYEQLSINKNLTLRGYVSGTQAKVILAKPVNGFKVNTSSLTTSDPIAAQIVVESPATSVTIADIIVDGSGNNLDTGCSDPRLIGIFFRDASGLLASTVVRNQAQGAANFGCASSAGLGIFVQSDGTVPSTVNIRDNTLYGFQENGITANETGTTVTVFGNSVLGAGPVNIAQNGIQIGYGATGTIQSNVVADNIFNGNPTAGTGSGLLIFDSANTTITGNSITFTQNGIAIQTDGAMPADGNSVSNNNVMQTQLNDGIDVCSNNNKISSNYVYTSTLSGIHLDSTCGSTGNNNYVVRNVVNDACAGFLVGSGTGNGVSANSIANTDFTYLAGDTCTPVVFSSAQVKREGVAQAHHTIVPARP